MIIIKDILKDKFGDFIKKTTTWMKVTMINLLKRRRKEKRDGISIYNLFLRSMQNCIKVKKWDLIEYDKNIYL